MGGSFYIGDSESVLVHICCSLSTTTNYGCAYNIISSSGSNYKNYAFECSISECYGKTSGVGGAFWNDNGVVQLSNINTSYNKITKEAAYGSNSPTGTGIFKFITASNTSSTGYSGIFNRGIYSITKCNYLNNEYTGSDNAIIYCLSGSISYSSCSFIGNKGNYLFYPKPQSVDNCYFHENSVTQTVRGDPITYQSINPLDSAISHYTTDKCLGTYIYPNLEENKDDSYKKRDDDELDLEDIKYLAINVYKTSFCEVINASSLL